MFNYLNIGPVKFFTIRFPGRGAKNAPEIIYDMEESVYEHSDP